MANLFATKPLNKLMNEAQETGEHCLKRTLGPMSLIMLGIGAIIGAGLFVRTADAIADRSGPSVVIAFIVAGFGCAFERDERRLCTHVEIFHRVLLAIEVNDEVNQVLELRISHELAQDRLLRFAGRAPRRMDRYEDRFARLLRRRKGFRIEGLGLGSDSRRNQSGAAGNDGEQNGSA